MKETTRLSANANTGKVNWSCRMTAMKRISRDFSFNFSIIFCVDECVLSSRSPSSPRR